MKSTKGAEGQCGAFKGQNAPRGRGAVPYIGNAPSAAPAAPSEGQVRILLSEAASQHLAGSGKRFFAIVAWRNTTSAS
jgi:hypothetical protein